MVVQRGARASGEAGGGGSAAAVAFAFSMRKKYSCLLLKILT